MADDIRTKAETWLDTNVPDKLVITSNGATAGKFQTITGLTHDGLVKSWKAQEKKPPGRRSILTSCNSFAGEYSRAVVGVYLGAIDPHQFLTTIKKQHAWVAATGDARPKKGDIVKGKGQHVFVSIKFDDNGKWHTVEGGQGGPQYATTQEKDVDGTPIWPLKGGHDIVKRSEKDQYDSSQLEGWIDLELFVGAAAQPPAPRQQTDGGTTGRLWLNADGDVAHPDAPTGGGGLGHFRSAGILHADPFHDGLPHPDAPVARTLDPLAVWKWEEELNNDRDAG